MGWVIICFIDFLDIHGLTAKTPSLRRQIHYDVICHTTARRRSWQLSPDSEIGPSDPTLPGHSWGQFLVGTIPRSIRICVPNLVMIGPAVWPPILDRHTDRQTDIICIIYILAGYPASLETLSSGLSPPPSLVPLSYSSLPSTLPPSDYPASLRITAFPRYVLNLEA